MMSENEVGKPKRTFKTREEWHEWVHSMYGSITDETFEAPADAYLVFDDEPSKNVLS